MGFGTGAGVGLESNGQNCEERRKNEKQKIGNQFNTEVGENTRSQSKRCETKVRLTFKNASVCKKVSGQNKELGTDRANFR